TLAPYRVGKTPRRPRAAWLPGYGPRADSAEAPTADTFSHRVCSSSIATRLRSTGRASRLPLIAVWLPQGNERSTRRVDAFVDSVLADCLHFFQPHRRPWPGECSGGNAAALIRGSWQRKEWIAPLCCPTWLATPMVRR